MRGHMFKYFPLTFLDKTKNSILVQKKQNYTGKWLWRIVYDSVNGLFSIKSALHVLATISVRWWSSHYSGWIIYFSRRYALAQVSDFHLVNVPWQNSHQKIISFEPHISLCPLYIWCPRGIHQSPFFSSLAHSLVSLHMNMHVSYTLLAGI